MSTSNGSADTTQFTPAQVADFIHTSKRIVDGLHTKGEHVSWNYIRYLVAKQGTPDAVVMPPGDKRLGSEKLADGTVRVFVKEDRYRERNRNNGRRGNGGRGGGQIEGELLKNFLRRLNAETEQRVADARERKADAEAHSFRTEERRREAARHRRSSRGVGSIHSERDRSYTPSSSRHERSSTPYSTSSYVAPNETYTAPEANATAPEAEQDSLMRALTFFSSALKAVPVLMLTLIAAAFFALADGEGNGQYDGDGYEADGEEGAAI